MSGIAIVVLGAADQEEKPVDAGVPNSFPYKDRVLAELAEEKRRVRSSV